MNKIKNLFNKHRKIAIVLVVLIIGGIAAWRTFGNQTQQPQYQTAQVQKGSIISTLSESGNISTTSQATINSPTDGYIQEIYVKDGDIVNVGDNLFKVKSTATPQQQQQAYASFLSAQNSLNSAKSQMNSLQAALFKANQAFITDKGISNPTSTDMTDPVYIEENATWLQAEANYTNQQGVISQAQVSLNSASLAYQATQDSVVTAPIAGTVANISVTVGSNIFASSSTNFTSNSSSSQNSAVLDIGDFSNPIVVVQASEVDVPQIKAGQKATITLDAFTGKTFVGTVTNVDTVGTSSSGVVTYNVYLTFVSPPSDIRPGMTATAVIETARKDNVLTVPTTAVQTSNNQSYVRVLKNGQISQAPVTTGISSDTDTEITSGLSEGDTVVTSILTSQSTGSSSSTSPFSGLGGGRGGFGGGGGGAAIRGGGAATGR